MRGTNTCTAGTDSRVTRYVADRMRSLFCGRGLEESSGFVFAKKLPHASKWLCLTLCNQAPILRCKVRVSLQFTGSRFIFLVRVVTDGILSAASLYGSFLLVGCHAPAPRCTLSASRRKLHHEVDHGFQKGKFVRLLLSVCTSVCLTTTVPLHF